jgi:putative ABC transport system permease protein
MTGLYRALLHLYPRWFRERYEEELVAAFVTDRAAARYRGAAGRLAFWLHISSDLVLSARRLRRETVHVPVHPGRSSMEALAQDLRHACRQLLRRPGFTTVAVLSLAIGIGGNALILALVDGFVLRPFHYPDPDRIVAVGSTFPRIANEERFVEAISVPEFLDLQRAATITSLAVFDLGNRNISGGDRPERVFTALAVTDPFGPFHVRPALGRGFTAEELAPHGPAAAVLSHRLWQGRFGGDPSIVGRRVRVNGAPMTVVGVMPPELILLGTDLWIPLGADLASMPRAARQFTIIGRLAPGASLADANAELSAIASRTSSMHGAAFEEYAGWRLAAVPWVDVMTRDLRGSARLLFGAVALVLLIACVNLSNLSLARSTTRQREMAVRLALGAGRSGIARHLLAEVVVLAAVGGALGLLLARAGLPFVLSLVPPEADALGFTASINGRVLAWAAALTIGCAVVVALLPVFQSTRTHPQEALKTDHRGATPGRARVSVRHALIVAEISLSVVLLVGAGLLVRSFANLRAIDPGFDPGGVLTLRLTLPAEKYQGAAINSFFQQLLDLLQQTPGVKAASVATQFPPQGVFSTAFSIEGMATQSDAIPAALITAASATHFSTLGVRIVRGRAFDDRDRAGAVPVAIVNQAFASRFLPGMSPLGRRIRMGRGEPTPPAAEIVGVAANTQNRDMRTPPAPEMFVPLLQQTLNNQLYLLVRSFGDPPDMLPAVRQQIAAIDPDQPIYAVRTLEAVVAAATFGSRFSMILLATFAAVALALAAVGIYGVMSFAVTARTQEIGVRLAVGADRGDVIWMVLKQVLRLAGAGLAIGVGAALAASAAIRSALFNVQPDDPLTIAAAAVLLGCVAIVAGWLPAWRASRINPITALRYE